MISYKSCTLAVLALIYAGLVVAQAPNLAYCSPEKNSGNYPAVISEYMSTGLCSDNCRGAYAFGIVQDQSCWCSNYIPADQVDTMECNSGCPGISTEWCGNVNQGLFAYLAIDLGKPLGTSGSSASNTPARTSSVSISQSSLRSSPPSASRPPSTSLVTLVPPQSSVRTSTNSRSSRIVPTDSTSESLDSPSSPTSESETTQAPSVIVSYITTGLVPTTVLITQSPASTTDDATLGQSRTAGSKGGVSGGAIAGIVIGVIGGLAAVITALVWFFCRRRRRDQERSRNSSFVAERVGPSSSGQQSNSIPSRQVSQMSQAGLLGSKAPRINTAFGGAGSLGLGSPTDPGSSTADRRSVGTDQRLNPWAIYKQDDQKSSVSLQDDRDYSRQLRVANPDD